MFFIILHHSEDYSKSYYIQPEMNMHNVVLFHQTRGHRRSQTNPNSPVNSADGSILPTNLGGQNGSVPWCVLKGEAVTDLLVCVFI